MGKTLTPSGSVNDGNGGNDYDVTFVSMNTGVINQAMPQFSNLSAPTILPGQPMTTVSGTISVPGSSSSGTMIPPGSVTITLQDQNNNTIETETANIMASGNFSAAFVDTAALTVSGSPYTLVFNYPGSTEFASQSTTSQLTVGAVTPTFVTAPTQTITYGTEATVAGTISAPGVPATPMASLTGTMVSTIAVTSGGSNYSAADPPLVMIAAPPSNGTQATATAVVSASGIVTAIDVVNPGSGYTSTPAVTILPSLLIPPGTVTITLTDQSNNLIEAETPSVDPTTGSFTAIFDGAEMLAVSGTPYKLSYSYTTSSPSFNSTVGKPTVLAVQAATPMFTNLSAPSITFGTPTTTIAGTISVASSPASASATVIGGEVTAITLTNGGAGYTSIPNVTINGNGSGATATATLTGDVVTAITVTNPGTGYTTPPTVTIGLPYTPASATASVSGGAVTSITLNPAGGSGAGYLSVPVVTITGGGGTGATATAVIDGDGLHPGQITAINITNGGTGYTAPPTVSIGSGSLVPPNNETVKITLEDNTGTVVQTQTAPIDPASGNFSAPFNTSNLSFAKAPYSLLFSYTSDTNFQSIQATTNLQIPHATSSVMLISSSPTQESYFGNALTFTATIIPSSGTVTGGTVTFTDLFNNATLGIVSVNVLMGGAEGQAVLSGISALVPGAHMIQASYSGDVNLFSSSDTLTQKIDTYVVMNSGDSATASVTHCAT